MEIYTSPLFLKCNIMSYTATYTYLTTVGLRPYKFIFFRLKVVLVDSGCVCVYVRVYTSKTTSKDEPTIPTTSKSVNVWKIL